MNQDCQCAFDAAYITSALLTCDPQGTPHAIFRARLSSFARVNSEDLILLLEDWVSTGSASIVLEFIQLNLDPACSVMIDSFDDPVCISPAVTLDQPNTPTVGVVESSTTMLYTITGLGAALGVGVILAIACVVVCLVYCKRINLRSILDSIVQINMK